MPVIILLQEAFGINHHIKSVCQRLAREGFLVIAPELYHRFGKHLTVDYSDRQKIMPLLGELQNEEVLIDIKATLHFVRELPRANSAEIYTMGFCVGGFASMLAATEFKLSGAIAFYGAGVVKPREGFKLRPFIEKLSHVTCPVLLFYGEKDASIPREDREEIIKALIKDGNKPEVHLYSDADHGFFCDERKSYHQEAASDAWKRTLIFLK